MTFTAVADLTGDACGRRRRCTLPDLPV